MQQQAVLSDSARVRRKRPFLFKLYARHSRSRRVSHEQHPVRAHARARDQRRTRRATPVSILHVSSYSSEHTGVWFVTIRTALAKTVAGNAAMQYGLSTYDRALEHAIEVPGSPVRLSCWFLADQAHLKRSCVCKSCATLIQYGQNCSHRDDTAPIVPHQKHLCTLQRPHYHPKLLWS